MRLIDADALMEDIKSNAYIIRDVFNSTDEGMSINGIQYAIDNAPTAVAPVTPTVSEDCISREQVRAKLDYISYAEKDPITIAKRIVDNAPSVTPPKKVVAQISVDTEELIERIKEEYKITDKVGEWIDTEFLKLKECSCCHCRWGMYDVENFDYCPTCGAKMGRKDGEA